MKERPILMERFQDKYIPVTESGCWLWIGACDCKGRARIAYKGRNARASHVAWELFRGPVPVGSMLCHHCDIPACVNPDHLYIGDSHTNVQDMMRRGRNTVPVGESHWKSKLTEVDVLAIRGMSGKGYASWRVAKIFGVSSSTIRRIWRMDNWRHVR